MYRKSLRFGFSIILSHDATFPARKATQPWMITSPLCPERRNSFRKVELFCKNVSSHCPICFFFSFDVGGKDIVCRPLGVCSLFPGIQQVSVSSIDVDVLLSRERCFRRHCRHIERRLRLPRTMDWSTFITHCKELITLIPNADSGDARCLLIVIGEESGNRFLPAGVPSLG